MRCIGGDGFRLVVSPPLVFCTAVQGLLSKMALPLPLTLCICVPMCMCNVLAVRFHPDLGWWCVPLLKDLFVDTVLVVAAMVVFFLIYEFSVRAVACVPTTRFDADPSIFYNNI